MRTKTINLYTFDELSDKAKQRARDWWRECEAQEFGGHGELNEPIESAAGYLGIHFDTHPVRLMSGKDRIEPKVWWTLHVQGAGASFDGCYEYRKGSVRDLKADFATDSKLHAIAESLAFWQRKHRYQLTAVVKSDSRCHSIDVSVCDANGALDDETAADAIRDAMKEFCRWVYDYISAEWDYRMKDENVDESILANEYTFTEDGKRED